MKARSRSIDCDVEWPRRILRTGDHRKHCMAAFDPEAFRRDCKNWPTLYGGFAFLRRNRN